MRAKRPWYRSSGYKHLDVPVGIDFADKTADAIFVATHSWLPLIKYIKSVKRYKPSSGKTILKERPIMYASHRDSCILKRYAIHLSALLDKHYLNKGLDRAVIAYRKLGKANYDFSADAFPVCEKDDALHGTVFRYHGVLRQPKPSNTQGAPEARPRRK